MLLLGFGPQPAYISAKPNSHSSSIAILIFGRVLSYRRVKQLVQFGVLLLRFAKLAAHFKEHTPLVIIQTHGALGADVAPLHDLAHCKRVIDKCFTSLPIESCILTLSILNLVFWQYLHGC